MNVRKLGVAGLTSVLLVGLLGIGATSAVAADPTTATVSGKVTLNGKPLAGVTVAIIDSSTASWAGAPTTDANGVYSAEWVTPGSYVVEVAGGTYTSDYRYVAGNHLRTYSGNTVRLPDATSFTVTAGQTKTVNVAAVAGATVKGKVVDAKGKAVAGAEVWASNATRSGYSSATTDKSGAYVLKGLATGKVNVWASKGKDLKVAFGDVSVSAKQGASKTAKNIKITKAKYGTITATVKNLKKNDTVWVYDTKSKYSFQLAIAKKSTLKIKEQLSPGTYRIVVGGQNAASKAVTVKAGKTAKVGTYNAAKKRTKVSGTIKGSNGKALANASVSVVDSYGTSVFANTNAKGKYSVSGVVSGKYTVEVWDSSRKNATSSVKLTVKKGKNATKNVKLAAGYKISGTVKYKGKAVEGIEVYAGNAWGTTNAKGKFTLTHVAKGKQYISAYDTYVGGYLNASKTVTVKKNLTWNVSLKK